MVDLTPSATENDKQLAELVEEITRKLEAGERIDVNAYASHYPDQVDPLRKLIPTLEALVLVGQEPALPPDGPTLDKGDAICDSGQLGDFRLIRELGRGGMGTVFEAEQISMGRRVAVKVLPFAALVRETSLQRFRNEVRAAAALDHPHIVSVYFVGEERGVHFFAMQFIRGQSLADMIHDLQKSRNGPAVGASSRNIFAASAGHEKDRAIPAGRRGKAAPSVDLDVAPPPSTHRCEQACISTAVGSRQSSAHVRQAARLGIQAAEALQHAHDMGVLHRDIKPGNLLLDAAGELYIADFGLARIEADAGLTMTGDMIGTLRYMAPEQALAKRVVVDQRGDIYSLGATLYELITLQPAFGETDRSELLKQIAFDEPRPLRKIDRHIPVDLETVVLKAMAKRPDERYQTAQLLADDLRAFLEGRTTRAKPSTTMARAVKWSRRHPAASRSAGIILIMTLLGSLLATILIWQANQRVADALAESQGNYRQAERQRRAAELNADKTAAVIEFLTNDLLAAAKPDIDQRGDLTVKEVLAKADARIKGAFAGQPELEVAVRVAVGRSYQALGDFARAMDQFGQAHDIAVAELGPTSMEAITAHYNSGRLLNIAHKLEEASMALNAVLKTCLQELGPDDPLTVCVNYQLGNNARLQGRDEEAIPILVEVLDARRQIYGDDHEWTLATLGDLAMAYLHHGDITEAETLAQERLNSSRRLYGLDDLRLIKAEQSLVRIPSESRSHDDIRLVRENVLAAYRVAYGSQHYKTMEAMQELARTYSALGRDDQAARLTAEAAEGLQAAQMRTHWND